jgi:hypothetical protein
MFHKEGRECPNCKRSRAFVRGGRVKEGAAFIEWDDDALRNPKP